MKYVPLLALPLLASCVSDQRIAQIQANHRVFVCSHQTAVTLAANAAIASAGRITNDDARAALIAIANADLAIVASCPASSE